MVFWNEGPELDTGLFVRGCYPWTVQTDAALLPPDRDAEQDAEPEAARSWGLSYALSGGQVSEVVEVESRRQRGHATPEQLVQALNHYMEHDAFLGL